MPFGHVFSPSIGLSLLKAELAAQGLPASIRYFSLRFAELIGRHLYHGIASDTRPSIEDLVGEWIFSRALFGSRAWDGEYVDEILRRHATWTSNHAAPPASDAFIDRILRARERSADFLQWCLGEVLRARPRLVGFTSMFQQHVASLALACLVKQSLPEAFIVFGGANCEGSMGAETVRQFPFVDAAVSGEADLVFPTLARRVLEDQPVSDLPGVRTRHGVEGEFASARFSPGPIVRDLDALPYPDYSDFFAQFEASRLDGRWRPNIFFETSRGCWWGERMHCTFCGLNGQTMAFRSKSPRRAMDELNWLAERHPRCSIQATDNILDMRYFKDFVPALAARPRGPELFYEVKANLKKEQLRLLRDGRIRHIQPGIESLSDPVLKLMRKGVDVLQNIQLLKWCKELGVEPAWNLLWGFPGEPPEEYERMARLVPLLTHLQPPDGSGMIRLDRFSPNFDDADRLGFEDVEPLPPYRYVYPLPGEALANLAYFFTFRYREPRDVGSYVGRLRKELSRWRRRWPRHDLFSVDTGECLLIWDLRSVRTALLTVLRGADRVLYRACDCASDVRRLGEVLQDDAEGPFPPGAIEQRLAPVLASGLLIRDGSRYLALAVPLGEYSPPPSALERFYDLVDAVGSRVARGWLVSPGVAGRSAGRVDSSSKVRSRVRGRPRGRPVGRLTVSQFSIDGGRQVLIRFGPRALK
jgi:ribosomal peptide maturation radical SAM protein 1